MNLTGIQFLGSLIESATLSKSSTASKRLPDGSEVTCEINGYVPFFWLDDRETGESYEPATSHLIDIIERF